MTQGQYDQRALYIDGLPVLGRGYLPREFIDFLNLQESHIASLENEYPNLHEMLRVQNPDFVIVTTEKMGARARYPKLLEKPGSYFQVHIPRDKNNQIITIEDRTIQTAVEQVEYPLVHFDKVHTILIETGDLYQSRRIARELTYHNPWAKDWLKTGHQVFIAESSRSRTTRIEEFKPYEPQNAA